MTGRDENWNLFPWTTWQVRRSDFDDMLLKEAVARGATLLKGKARVGSPKHAALTAARYLFACVAGCIVLDYLLGFIVQSAITGVAMPVVAIASMGFIVGDCIKAVVASLVASGLAKLQ